jgi:hypothetical protein
MLTKVTSVEMLGGFRLRVRFNDGSGGVHDFAAMTRERGPMLQPLRTKFFSAVCSWSSARRLGQMASTLHLVAPP